MKAETPDWSLAECKDVVDANIFFVGRGGSYKEARAYCGRCVIREACLEDALQVTGYEDYGMRGGLSQRQREKLRKERNGIPS